MRPVRSRLTAALIILAAVLGLAAPVLGHALQPGYLQLRLVDTDFYGVVWKKPAVKSKPLDIFAVLPENCEVRTAENTIWDGRAYVARWTTRCPGGIEGGVIRIDGLEATRTDVLVSYEFTDGSRQTHRLTPGNTAFTAPTQPSSLEVVRTYLVLGVKHILSGIDHLLFVLALLILVNGVPRLILTVTAFTLAHSLTLAGATLGLINMPGPPIEATIALSIMFVASEILHSRRGRVGLTERYPWVVAFTFGLLHGFGFAGALAQIGLPEASIPIALLFFNVGVEIGQLTFIVGVLIFIYLARKAAVHFSVPRPAWTLAVAIPPYVIGSMAAFWIFQRLTAFV